MDMGEPPVLLPPPPSPPPPERSLFAAFIHRLKKTLSSTIGAVAEAIISSVHIPEIAIGPIVGALITATTTLIIGLVTISNIFSEQILFRPLQLQESNANYNLALGRYHQSVLTDYLNEMGRLTLQHQEQLHQNPSLWRAKTQQTLGEIDGDRKRYVVMFLQDAHLLSGPQGQTLPPLLEGANLQDVQLRYARLPYANFQGADLRRGDLRGGDLHRGSLRGAWLQDADLSYGDLRGVDLSQAQIAGTRFFHACYDNLTQIPAGLSPEGQKMVLVTFPATCPAIPTDLEAIAKTKAKPTKPKAALPLPILEDPLGS